jgi:hypothetical protein
MADRPRYSRKRQGSDIRISTLSAEIWRAIEVVREQATLGELTYEEVLASLNQVSSRAIGYLLEGETA